MFDMLSPCRERVIARLAIIRPGTRFAAPGIGQPDSRTPRAGTARCRPDRARSIVAVLLRIDVQGRESGVPVGVEEAWAVWFREGRSRIEQHGTKREALKAVVLE
jgi:hypothetical protein